MFINQFFIQCYFLFITFQALLTSKIFIFKISLFLPLQILFEFKQNQHKGEFKKQMSIASEQRQINQILANSKGRLKQVQQHIGLLVNQKQSIDEDISILSHRLHLLKRALSKKKQAYETVESLYTQSDEAYQKLKQSTKTLLMAFKKQEKKVTNLLKATEKIMKEQEQNN